MKIPDAFWQPNRYIFLFHKEGDHARVSELGYDKASILKAVEDLGEYEFLYIPRRMKEVSLNESDDDTASESRSL